jgi:hypothetical protein
MTERFIDKLGRLGAEAGIKEMTPEIRRFAMLVRSEMLRGLGDFGKQMADAETLSSCSLGLREKKHD